MWGEYRMLINIGLGFGMNIPASAMTAEYRRVFVALSKLAQGETPEALGLEKDAVRIWPGHNYRICWRMWESTTHAIWQQKDGLWYWGGGDFRPKGRMLEDGSLELVGSWLRDAYNYQLPSRTPDTWVSGPTLEEVLEESKDARLDGWCGAPVGNF